MTSKEALSRLYDEALNNLPIEKAPKIHESYYELLKSIKKLEKLEKAIEILRKRGVMVDTYIRDQEAYIYGQEESFTKEEYELLKEVLK